MHACDRDLGPFSNDSKNIIDVPILKALTVIKFVRFTNNSRKLFQTANYHAFMLNYIISVLVLL